ncbi:MAG: MFS transporter [Gammaproteobacteria bacterium]|nr:MFS transporter [Gammaproteobacteria bacterium]
MDNQQDNLDDTLANDSRWYFQGWLLWSIAAIFYAYEFIHRVVPSILTEELRATFSVNEHQLGLIGAMYFYAYAAFQLPAGILVDRYGAKRLLIIASTVLTLGSFLFTTTSSGTVAQISRFMIGTGSAFAFVGCLKIGGQWLAVSSFPLVVGLTNLCGTLGALSGGKPLAYMIQNYGWHNVMMQISFVGLFITVLMWLFLKDSPPNSSSANEEPHHSLFAGLKVVMSCPQSWLIATYSALLVAPIVALPEMWGVEYLKITYNISATQASAITHTIFVGTAVGGTLIGWAMTFIEDKVKFMMIASSGAMILLSVFLYWNNIPFSNLYAILFCYGVLTANMLLSFTLITRLHPSWAQGAAIGFTNMVIMASGGLMQHGIGWLLHTLRVKHDGVAFVEDYHIAFSILPFCLLIAVILTFFMKQEQEPLNIR